MDFTDGTLGVAGIVFGFIALLLVLFWIFLPFLLISKMQEMLKESREHTKLFRQLHAELIDANSWHARNDAFNDDRRKRESFSR